MGVVATVVACSGTDASIPSESALTAADGGASLTAHPTATATGTGTPGASATPTATGTATTSPTTSPTGTTTAPTGGRDAGPPPVDAGPPPPPAATWTSQPTTSPGCGLAAKTSPQNGDTGSVSVNGTTRTYVYYVPASYDPNKAYPLVTLFHGIQATGEEMAQYIMMQVYSAPNAIVVFPDGANGGYWDTTGDTDLQFMDALDAKLEAQLCIDEQRTFALGFSLGAYMANHYACNRPTLRAFVAADGGYPDTRACKAPVAALIYHRQEDDNEPIANGVNARNHWLTNDGCSMSSSPFSSDGFQAPGGDVSGPAGCVSYSGCSLGTAPVLWCDDMYISPEGYKHDLRDVYRVPMWSWFDAF